MHLIPSKAIRGRLFDAAAVLLAAAFSYSDTLGSGGFRAPYGAVLFMVFVVSAASLALRRRMRVAVAWFAAASTLPLTIAELVVPDSRLYQDTTALVVAAPGAAPFAIYAVMVHARERRAAWPPVVVLTALVLVAALGSVRPLEYAAQSLVLTAAPALLGLYVAERGRLVEARVAQALVDERARIAAEMHDVVTHRVSLMVLQAGALRLTAADPATRNTAEELRTAGCQALEELRDMVGLLRDPDPATDERTLLPDLSPLLAESEAVGVPVELVEEGEPVLASPVVGRTAYRVVQEALTNVRKHAPGARVRVHIRHSPQGVRLTVHNTPPAAAGDTDLTGAGAGTGLLGLRQRVELISGTLLAAPDTDGGFRLEARLPA